MKIKQEYEETKKRLEELKQLVRAEEIKKKNLEKKLDITKIFNVSQIGKILAKLLTTVSEENYIFKTKIGDEEILKFGYMDKWIDHEKYVRFYIEKEGLNIDLTKPINMELKESGEFILLRNVSSYLNINDMLKIDLSLFHTITFPIEINFIGEFVSKLIDFRIENDLIDITIEDMEQYLNEYLSVNRKSLVEHYKMHKPRVVYIKK